MAAIRIATANIYIRESSIASAKSPRYADRVANDEPACETFSMPRSLAAVLVVLVLLGAACGKGSGKEMASNLNPLQINAGDKSVIVHVAIADTPEKLAQGLTGRESLGKDEGMLFVIERRGPGFWMKDTPIPLTV